MMFLLFVSVSQFACTLKLMSRSIALRQTQTITQILAQLHLRALSVSVTPVAMAFWLYAGVWPYHLDLGKMVPPSHLYDLSGANYIFKYYHVNSGRMAEWLCLFRGRAVHFIRRTKQLCAFLAGVTFALSLSLTCPQFYFAVIDLFICLLLS
jgi:hypothetical protein